MIERRALGRRFRADTRQPLAICVPTVLLVRARLGGVFLLFGVQRRSELMWFLVAHVSADILVKR
jgi:hypothetical protein